MRKRTRKNRIDAPKIRRHDGRQRAEQLLRAPIHLRAHARDALLNVNLELARARRLRGAPQRREHLARLAQIVVDRLLAHNDQIRPRSPPPPLDNRTQRPRDAQRLRRRRGLGEFDVHAGVGAHRERRAERLGGFGGPERDDRDRFHFVLQSLA